MFKAFFLIAVWLFSSITTAYAEQVEVSYQYNGASYYFAGEKRLNGYIFNAESKRVVSIATLNWPPYVGQELCHLGWSIQLAVSVLTAKGYRVEVYFFPWVRAVKLVESGEMDILFPEYFIEDNAPSDIFSGKKRRDLLVQSNAFIGGNIALLKRKNDPFEMSEGLQSLKNKVIGVVRGYQNTPEFDALMDQGLIKIIEAIDDAQLLKLLLARRVDLIVGDPKVFDYVIAHKSFEDDTRIALLNEIEQIDPPLNYNPLYFAISRKYLAWNTLLTDINLALIAFEQSGETARIYQQGGECN